MRLYIIIIYTFRVFISLFKNEINTKYIYIKLTLFCLYFYIYAFYAKLPDKTFSSYDHIIIYTTKTVWLSWRVRRSLWNDFVYVYIIQYYYNVINNNICKSSRITFTLRSQYSCAPEYLNSIIYIYI